jgi:Flp pilus assembly pilin Flp
MEHLLKGVRYCPKKHSNGVCLRPLSQQSWREMHMTGLVGRLCSENEGQDIAEYAVMLAVILVIVVGAIQLIGSNANAVFSNAASSLQ